MITVACSQEQFVHLLVATTYLLSILVTLFFYYFLFNFQFCLTAATTQ